MEGEGGGRGKWEEMEGACGERRESVIYLFSTTFNCSKRILNNLFKIKNSMLEMSHTYLFPFVCYLEPNICNL